MDDEILYVIGNGFDLSHDIESSYSDFKQYVKRQGNSRLIDLMINFFSNKRELWNDIETALGEYDESEIFSYCKPEEDDDDHMLRSVAATEDAPDWIFKPILDEFIDSFRDWVDSIDITQAERHENLSVQSKYLTFNYTDTLESIYGIPSDQILHIHGSRLVKDDEYIIGHNDLREQLDYNDKEFDYIVETKNKIISWMNKHYKDTDGIIKCNQQFFDNLNNIKGIKIIGHSLNEVDWQYFDEIKAKVHHDAKWIFYAHSPKDENQARTYFSHARIKNYEIE